MRLVLVGTGPFGLPSFERLFEGPYPIVALVTAPVRPHRGRGPAPVYPVRELAGRHATPVLDPEDVNAASSIEALRALGADLLVVCDYGQILSADTLATARLGGINLHGSLLPRYRGAAPVAWALYHGETETGVSVIHMTPRIDAGPVVAQVSTPIADDETAEALEVRLARLGAEPMVEAVRLLEEGRAEPLPQDASRASKAPRLKKAHGLLDWSRPAAALRNHVRAVQPWPKAHTFWLRPAGEPLRLILGALEVVESPDPEAAPGTVLEASGARLVVAAGEGACRLTTVQAPGKRALPVREFLLGQSLQAGDRFGPG